MGPHPIGMAPLKKKRLGHRQLRLDTVNVTTQQGGPLCKPRREVSSLLPP